MVVTLALALCVWYALYKEDPTFLIPHMVALVSTVTGASLL